MLEGYNFWTWKYVLIYSENPYSTISLFSWFSGIVFSCLIRLTIEKIWNIFQLDGKIIRLLITEEHILVFRKLSILPFLSFLCFNLGNIFLFVWVVLGVQYKLLITILITILPQKCGWLCSVIKEKSLVTICHFCVAGYLRKTLL